ncbi:glycosyltransferase family 2 protein [Enterovibrio norvegicus]|uniref:glycosyltransferase family 2 protein n=1 Tax=Enterovibrio norvegicus TaxID=188144 RepID=UPI00389A577D
MYKNNTIGVVVPAFNEENLIGRVIETMPDYVDYMFIVNDGSSDKTKEIVQGYAENDQRIVLVDHKVNKGLGQSLIDGYLAAREYDIDAVAVMAGDAQMNPDDLCNLLDPVVTGKVDYTKGNRLLREEVVERMPRHRLIGNSGLSLLTKFATGYWHSIDPQCGYTVISKKALVRIPIETMIKGYGYNAHILWMLNINNFKIKDVEIEPVYGEEKSKIKLKTYIPTVSKLLVKLFHQRLLHKYVLRDFNPLVLFYLFAFVNGILLGAPLLIRLIYKNLMIGYIPTTTLILLSFSVTNAFLALFFAMWMDMEANKNLTDREDE